MPVEIIAIGFHFQASGANRDPIGAKGDTVVISGLLGVSKIKIDVWSNTLALAEFVHGHGVMSGVKQQGGRFQIRSQSPEAEECFAESMGIMLRSLVKGRKERQLTVGIGKQVQVIAKVPVFTGRIPADITIGLREEAVTVAVEDTLLPAVAGVMRTKPGSSNNRSSVASDTKSIRTNESATDRFIHEASSKDLEHESICFLVGREDCSGKTDDQIRDRFLLNRGGLSPFLLRLLELTFIRRLNMRREIRSTQSPETIQKVIEGTDTRNVIRVKAAEKSVEGRNM